MTVYLAFQYQTAPANSSKHWNDFRYNTTGVALLDEQGQATGLTAGFVQNATRQAAVGADQPGTGGCSWVDEAPVMGEAVGIADYVGFIGFEVSGFAGDPVNVGLAVSQDAGQVTIVRVNGGAEQELPEGDQLTDGFLEVQNVLPVDGVVLLEFRAKDTSEGTDSAYFNAIYIGEGGSEPAEEAGRLFRPFYRSVTSKLSQSPFR